MADQDNIASTAKELSELATNFDGSLPARMALLGQTDKLRYMLETPMDPILRQLSTISSIAALNLLVSSGVLQAVAKDGSSSASYLSKEANIDESVIMRSMRIICAQGIGEEVRPNEYRHNAKSLAFIQGNSAHFFYMVLDYMKPMYRLPEYFKSHDAGDLRNIRKSPYAWGHDLEGMDYYEVISSDPRRFEAFNDTLAQMDKQQPVLGMFPFHSLKEQVEADPDRPFIVDVGGGTGNVLKSIQMEAPGGFGADMILQDRPDVIASMKDEDILGIKKMAHDFFQPQLVKGAQIYLFRRVLHDFYDDVCVEILKNVASAMAPSSRLLIGDFVVPEKSNLGDDPMIYWMDYCMMIATGTEKTASQFKMILEGAGMDMVKIWPAPFGPQAMIEARLRGA